MFTVEITACLQTRPSEHINELTVGLLYIASIKHLVVLCVVRRLVFFNLSPMDQLK